MISRTAVAARYDPMFAHHSDELIGDHQCRLANGVTLAPTAAASEGVGPVARLPEAAPTIQSANVRPTQNGERRAVDFR